MRRRKRRRRERDEPELCLTKGPQEQAVAKSWTGTAHPMIQPAAPMAQHLPVSNLTKEPSNKSVSLPVCQSASQQTNLCASQRATQMTVQFRSLSL